MNKAVSPVPAKWARTTSPGNLPEAPGESCNIFLRFMGCWFLPEATAPLSLRLPWESRKGLGPPTFHPPPTSLSFSEKQAGESAPGPRAELVYEQKWQFICRQKNYILHKLFTINLTFIPLLLLLLLIVSADVRIDPPCADRISPLRDDRTSSGCLRRTSFDPSTAAPIASLSPRPPLVSIRRRADRVSFPAPASPLYMGHRSAVRLIHPLSILRRW